MIWAIYQSEKVLLEWGRQSPGLDLVQRLWLVGEVKAWMKTRAETDVQATPPYLAGLCIYQPIKTIPCIYQSIKTALRICQQITQLFEDEAKLKYLSATNQNNPMHLSINQRRPMR